MRMLTAEEENKLAQFDEMFSRLQRAHAQLNEWPIDRRSGKRMTQEDVDNLQVAAQQLIHFNVKAPSALFEVYEPGVTPAAGPWYRCETCDRRQSKWKTPMNQCAYCGSDRVMQD